MSGRQSFLNLVQSIGRGERRNDSGRSEALVRIEGFVGGDCLAEVSKRVLLRLELQSYIVSFQPPGKGDKQPGYSRC
jgi:hypothetical protein